MPLKTVCPKPGGFGEGFHGNGSRVDFSLVVQGIKNVPAMRETRVRSLDQKGPLEKGMATHSSILAWRTAWTEEPGGLQSMGSQRVGHNLATEQQQI